VFYRLSSQLSRGLLSVGAEWWWMYCIATRPDIAYTIGVLCQFVENPGMVHWLAAKRVLQYLKGTVNTKLVYSQLSSPDLFTTYSDAD